MKKRYFYIASSPTYGGDYLIKIGISDNPKKRLVGIRKYDPLFKLCAVFKIEDDEFPVILECDLIARFYKNAYQEVYFDNDNCEYRQKRLGKEFFRGEPEDFISYAENRIKQSQEKYARVL